MGLKRGGVGGSDTKIAFASDSAIFKGPNGSYEIPDVAGFKKIELKFQWYLGGRSTHTFNNALNYGYTNSILVRDGDKLISHYHSQNGNGGGWYYGMQPDLVNISDPSNPLTTYTVGVVWTTSGGYSIEFNPETHELTYQVFRNPTDRYPGIQKLLILRD